MAMLTEIQRMKDTRPTNTALRELEQTYGTHAVNQKTALISQKAGISSEHFAFKPHAPSVISNVPMPSPTMIPRTSNTSTSKSFRLLCGGPSDNCVY
mmetsp:Transcript_23658/g.33051  ORF Transcript_23658/g.33051 Transcript_23658/m.33051 type:complete len:97 (-) Transcript_23658:28-318(-)